MPSKRFRSKKNKLSKSLKKSRRVRKSRSLRKSRRVCNPKRSKQLKRNMRGGSIIDKLTKFKEYVNATKYIQRMKWMDRYSEQEIKEKLVKPKFNTLFPNSLENRELLKIVNEFTNKDTAFNNNATRKEFIDAIDTEIKAHTELAAQMLHHHTNQAHDGSHLMTNKDAISDDDDYDDFKM